MQILPGRLRLEDIIVSQVTAQNSAPITVTTSEALILGIALGTVTLDSIFFIDWMAPFDKGLTGGESFVRLGKQSGTATIRFMHNQGDVLIRTPDQPASSTWARQMQTVGVVTVGGTLNLRMTGRSLGSDSTVETGAAQFNVLGLLLP